MLASSGSAVLAKCTDVVANGQHEFVYSRHPDCSSDAVVEINPEVMKSSLSSWTHRPMVASAPCKEPNQPCPCADIQALPSVVVIFGFPCNLQTECKAFIPLAWIKGLVQVSQTLRCDLPSLARPGPGAPAAAPPKAAEGPRAMQGFRALGVRFWDRGVWIHRMCVSGSQLLALRLACGVLSV